MDRLTFTEEEIQGQLAILGYKNIPQYRLHEFKQDLDEMIQRGEWRSLTPSPNVSSQGAAARPSPPAYIKEKVGPMDGFFLHADRKQQDLLTVPNSDDRWQRGSCDSYANNTVAPRLRLPPGAPSRLQVEADSDKMLISSFSDSPTSSRATQGRRFIKRKVVRKHKGQQHICDESYSEDSDATSCLEDRLAELRISPSGQWSPLPETEEESDQSYTQSSGTEGGTLRAFESYVRGLTRVQSDSDLRPKPKSFIRPVISQQTMKKTDPVAKYFQYKQLWDMFKCPGEMDRRALRWEIREQLAYQPPPPKPRRVYVPNTYTVPTEKKRSALRWEVRNALANGLCPYKSTTSF